jgi:hypothetical protein
MRSLLDRWRAGRAAKRRNEHDYVERRLPTKGEATVKTPSNAAAEALIDVLRKHGYPAETTRPQGRKVRIAESEGDRRGGLLRAIQMWLMLDSTPDRAKVRFGRRWLSVERPADAEVAGR